MWLQTLLHTALSAATSSARIIMRVLRERDIEFAELQGGITAVLWGVYVGNPLWSALSQSARFFTVADVIPEWAWGTASLAIGFVQLGSVVTGSWQWRRWAAFVLWWFWTLLAAQFGAANFRSPIILLYAVFSFAAFWVHVRISLRRPIEAPADTRATPMAGPPPLKMR